METLCEQPAPRLEGVDPGPNRVAVAPKLCDRELAAPAVVLEWRHPGFVPIACRFVAVEDDARERVMTVGEDVSLDCDPIPDRALAREPAGVDLGADRLDGHTKPPFSALVWGSRSRKRTNTDAPPDRNPSHDPNRDTWTRPPSPRWIKSEPNLPPPVQGGGLGERDCEHIHLTHANAQID